MKHTFHRPRRRGCVARPAAAAAYLCEARTPNHLVSISRFRKHRDLHLHLLASTCTRLPQLAEKFLQRICNLLPYAKSVTQSVALIGQALIPILTIMRCVIPMLLLAVAACGEEILDPSVKPMRAVIDRFSEDSEALERRYSLRDAETRKDRLTQFYREQLDRVQQLKYSDLDVAGRIDYALLRARCEAEIHELP